MLKPFLCCRSGSNITCKTVALGVEMEPIVSKFMYRMAEDLARCSCIIGTANVTRGFLYKDTYMLRSILHVKFYPRSKPGGVDGIACPIVSRQCDE